MMTLFLLGISILTRGPRRTRRLGTVYYRRYRRIFITVYDQAKDHYGNNRTADQQLDTFVVTLEGVAPNAEIATYQRYPQTSP